MLVLLSHLYLPGDDAFGWVGVDMFFVLSGFLITTILVDEHRRTGLVSLRGFYMRRIRRLAPALLALVVVVTAIDLTVTHGDAVRNGISVLLYVANWQVARGTELGGLSHTWSLSIEEQFYLLWPAALIILLRRGGALVAGRVALGLTLTAIAWRVILWSGGASLFRVYFGSDTRADALMAGCALALLAPSWRPARGTVIVATLVLVGACAGQVLDPGWTLMLDVGLAATAGATVVVIANRPAILAFPPLVTLGTLSYSVYLWQFPVMYSAHELFGVTPAWAIPVVVAVAALSYRFIERPFRYPSSRERDRLELGDDPASSSAVGGGQAPEGGGSVLL